MPGRGEATQYRLDQFSLGETDTIRQKDGKSYGEWVLLLEGEMIATFYGPMAAFCMVAVIKQMINDPAVSEMSWTDVIGKIS